MSLPNVAWALRYYRWERPRFSVLVDIAEAGLAEGLEGSLEFTAEERGRIARALGFPEGWLFGQAALLRNTAWQDTSTKSS